jgi:hypothetical protein
MIMFVITVFIKEILDRGVIYINQLSLDHYIKKV